MPDSSRTSNPFHALLVVVSVVFTLSACAYGVMAVRNMNPGQQAPSPDRGHLLIEVLERYGTTILLIELAVLAVVVAAAIGTEAYRKRRIGKRQRPTIAANSRETRSDATR